MKKVQLCLILTAIILSPIYGQENWTQFRGNNRNGISSEKSINESRLADGKGLQWKHSYGGSYAEILTYENKVYTTITEQKDSLNGAEYLIALNASDGKELWKTRLDSMIFDADGAGEPSRSTPAIDGEKAFCISNKGKVLAVSLKDGAITWIADLVRQFGFNTEKIYTSSPILVDDMVIVEVGVNESKGFAAFDKESGDNLWITGEGVPSYSSPTVLEVDGNKQIIFANGPSLMSFSTKGELLWSHEMAVQSPTAVPLLIGPDQIFVSSGRGCFLAKIDETGVSEVYNCNSMRNTFSTSCYYGDHIYGISSNGLKCISVKDGEPQWKEKGFGLGNITLVGNKIVALTDKGDVKVIDTNPEVFTERVSYKALAGKCYTAPSFAGGVLYVRDLNEIAAIKLSE